MKKFPKESNEKFIIYNHHSTNFHQNFKKQESFWRDGYTQTEKSAQFGQTWQCEPGDKL